ncbi:MAG: extracellular solute-binding protein [Porticoccaceae bacterium]|nr:extracellular solute-binding protein [Pseudomonadales bacterium]MCP5172444.1 extracellular solute-binding protein [Pseudomonadales bacterium]
MKKLLAGLVMVASTLVAVQVVSGSTPVDEVVVYSARKEHLIKPLFDAYTKKTGVKIRYITDSAAPLLARLKAEGSRTPADILMTVDAGNLWQAADSGVLATLNSKTLQDNIPAHLRDPQNRWYGLSVRARTIVYNTEALKAEELSSYENLADPEWRGRLCLRTSKKVYNQSLVAMMIARLGEKKTEQIVEGWIDNLAAAPYGSDNDVMSAIEAGQCDVGIVNTYYFGRLQKSNPATSLALFWANQGADENGGVHINVSGAGITRFAPNPGGAQALLEWLSSAEAQGMFAGINLEYPVNPDVAVDPQVVAWGKFKADRQNLSTAGELQVQAVMLMDRAGYR